MCRRANWKTFDEVVMDFSITCEENPFLLQWLSNERRNNNSMYLLAGAEEARLERIDDEIEKK